MAQWFFDSARFFEACRKMRNGFGNPTSVYNFINETVFLTLPVVHSYDDFSSDADRSGRGCKERRGYECGRFLPEQCSVSQLGKLEVANAALLF